MVVTTGSQEPPLLTLLHAQLCSGGLSWNWYLCLWGVWLLHWSHVDRSGPIKPPKKRLHSVDMYKTGTLRMLPIFYNISYYWKDASILIQFIFIFMFLKHISIMLSILSKRNSTLKKGGGAWARWIKQPCQMLVFYKKYRDTLPLSSDFYTTVIKWQRAYGVWKHILLTRICGRTPGSNGPVKVFREGRARWCWCRQGSSHNLPWLLHPGVDTAHFLSTSCCFNQHLKEERGRRSVRRTGNWVQCHWLSDEPKIFIHHFHKLLGLHYQNSYQNV